MAESVPDGCADPREACAEPRDRLRCRRSGAQRRLPGAGGTRIPPTSARLPPVAPRSDTVPSRPSWIGTGRSTPSSRRFPSVTPRSDSRSGGGSLGRESRSPRAYDEHARAATRSGEQGRRLRSSGWAAVHFSVRELGEPSAIGGSPAFGPARSPTRCACWLPSGSSSASRRDRCRWPQPDWHAVQSDPLPEARLVVLLVQNHRLQESALELLAEARHAPTRLVHSTPRHRTAAREAPRSTHR